MIEVEHASLTDNGTMRDSNEDSCGFKLSTEPGQKKGHLFVVADGVGGYNAGEVASAAAVEKVLAHYYETGASGKVERALEEALQAANMHIYDLAHSEGQYSRMQTTITAVALVEQTAYIGHVGDTRVYHVRDNNIRQLTGDHSEVGEMVRMRIITPEQARKHPNRNIITRSLGSDIFLRPDFARVPLLEGDNFVLCTDGLWEVVEDAEIAIAVQSMSPEDACAALVDLALFRQTSDNLTIQVLRVKKIEATPTSETPRTRTGFSLPWGLRSRQG